MNYTDSGGSTSAVMVVLKQRSERNFENICMININQVILLLRGSQDCEHVDVLGTLWTGCAQASYEASDEDI